LCLGNYFKIQVLKKEDREAQEVVLSEEVREEEAVSSAKCYRGP
jgi:hypothetical protein